LPLRIHLAKMLKIDLAAACQAISSAVSGENDPGAQRWPLALALYQRDPQAACHIGSTAGGALPLFNP
jgi:hypothetical protein